jgi:3-oxoacyl-[acyl-carrier protein] reductase
VQLIPISLAILFLSVSGDGPYDRIHRKPITLVGDECGYANLMYQQRGAPIKKRAHADHCLYSLECKVIAFTGLPGASHNRLHLRSFVGFFLSLMNEVAIVTGGGRGIGRATAFALAREGARVVVAARTLAEIEAVAEEIRKKGGEALAIQTDVSREESVERMVENTVEAFGRIDILVNNAGVNIRPKSVIDLTREEWEWLMSINLTGVFLCSKHAYKRMVEQGSGKIVNVSSVGGRGGAKGRAPYRPSKAAIINFTECLAEEGKEHGVNVNAVCPGGTDTEMMRSIFPGREAANLMRPEEVAEIIVFLASESSRGLNGVSVDIPGK